MQGSRLLDAKARRLLCTPSPRLGARSSLGLTRHPPQNAATVHALSRGRSRGFRTVGYEGDLPRIRRVHYGITPYREGAMSLDVCSATRGVPPIYWRLEECKAKRVPKASARNVGEHSPGWGCIASRTLSAAHLGTYRRAAGGKHEKAPFLISSMGRAHVSRPFVKDELPQFLSVGRQNLLTAADVSRETSPSFPALIGARNRASCHAAPTIFRVSRDSASDVSRETSLADPRPSSKKVE
jgi:hypothetical protein